MEPTDIEVALGIIIGIGAFVSLLFAVVLLYNLVTSPEFRSVPTFFISALVFAVYVGLTDLALRFPRFRNTGINKNPQAQHQINS